MGRCDIIVFACEILVILGLMVLTIWIILKADT